MAVEIGARAKREAGSLASGGVREGGEVGESF